jgi:hypothetical protein
MPEELTMKKDVAASAAGTVAPKKPEFSLIDEDLLKSRIYTIRGVKVMLDADLAEIYGYSTKDFNRQVKNNIERFAEDFRFQLTKREVEELRSKKFTAITDANDAKDLRCKNCTANISTMSRSNPYVFTEQGIYMLMTVLKGDLAVQQSMALIRLFKQMKDYIATENAPDVSAGIVALATQTSQNTRDIAEIATDVRTLSSKVERRYIYLDFGTDTEKLFHCGASSKDAGNKITTIMQLEDIAGYRALFEKLLQPSKNTPRSSGRP